jgi:hypothetical protein
MRRFLKGIGSGVANNAEKKVLDSSRLCMQHNQSLYPNLLAVESVYEINKKVCYLCAGKYMLKGSLVSCRV